MWEQWNQGNFSTPYSQGYYDKIAEYEQANALAAQKAAMAQKNAAERQAAETARANRPWIFKAGEAVGNFAGSVVKPVVNTAADFWDSGVSSIKSLWDNRALDEYKQRSLERYGASDEKDLAAKRLGSAIETVSWAVPGGASLGAKGLSTAAKAARMGKSGAAAGAIGGAGMGLTEGGRDATLESVLAGAGQGALMGGALGAALPVAGRGLNAIKNQGANRIISKQGLTGTTKQQVLDSATRRNLYGNGLAQLAGDHKLATAGLAGTALWNAPNMFSSTKPPDTTGLVTSYEDTDVLNRVAAGTPTQADIDYIGTLSDDEIDQLPEDVLMQLLYGGYI
jgi:hypothetical protein